jgi:site-specific DNA recombinase
MNIGATYARVSTLKQKDGISLEQQEGEMLSYATSQQIEIPASYRFKEQVSGYTDVREYYDEIRTLIRGKRISDLIVYSSDRLTRDPIHGELFREEMRNAGVTLHFVTQGGKVDITSPQGIFMQRIMNTVDSYIGDYLKKTMYEKKQGYIAAGIPYVSGFAKYGLERVGKKKDACVIPVPEEQETILSIYSWYDQGMTIDQICESLYGIPSPSDKVGNAKRKKEQGTWTPSTVYNILHDSVYRGVYYCNRTKVVKNTLGKKIRQILSRDDGWIPINVPAIVPDELWHRVQARIESRRKASYSNRNTHEYLLTARSVCRHCGASVTGNTGSNKIGYYRCNRRYSKAYVDKGCDFMPERVDKCDTAVWNRLRELLKKPKALRALLLEAQEVQKKQVFDVESILENIDRVIAERKKQLNGFSKAIAAEHAQDDPNQDVIASLRMQANELSSVIAGLEQEKLKYLAQFNQKVIASSYIDNSVSYAESLSDQLDDAPFEVQKEAIEHFDIHFEFERNNSGDVVIHVQWLVWEFDLLVAADQPSRHIPSESSPSEWRRSRPSCGR